MDLKGKDVYIISRNHNDDDFNPLMFTGEQIQEAAKNPEAIGKILVDMAYAEGIVETQNGIMCYERNTKQNKRLHEHESGMEDLLTGGWIRLLLEFTPQWKLEGCEEVNDCVNAGIAVIHGRHRGFYLLEFLK